MKYHGLQKQRTCQNIQGLSSILYSFSSSKRDSTRRKEDIHLIPNWFRSSCSHVDVLQNFAKIMWKHLCWSHFLTTFQIIKKRLTQVSVICWSQFVCFFIHFFFYYWWLHLSEFTQKVSVNEDFFTFYNSFLLLT